MCGLYCKYHMILYNGLDHSWILGIWGGSWTLFPMNTKGQLCLFSLTERNLKRTFTFTKKKKKKSQKQNRVWCLFCRVWRLWRQHAPLQGEWGPKFLPRTTHSISASSCCNLEQCLWASVLYLNSFCVSISTEYFVCPKIIISLL